MTERRRPAGGWPVSPVQESAVQVTAQTPGRQAPRMQPRLPPRLTGAQRARQLANAVNGTTLLGLVVARAAGTSLSRGPRGLFIASGYAWRIPFAGAFTMGNVIICRSRAEQLLSRPALLGHEEKHCSQYAWCLGLPFLPLYFLAAGWSQLWTGNPASANVFERRAGLAAGGYVDGQTPGPSHDGTGDTGYNGYNGYNGEIED